MESSWKGVSIRGWLAIGIVFSGLGFMYITTWLAMLFISADVGTQIALMVIGLVGTTIGAATGYYFGQKGVPEKTPEPEAPVIPVGREPTG